MIGCLQSRKSPGLAIPFLDILPAIRVLLGFILVFFSRRQINIIERLALSFGLSIASITLGMLALNRLIRDEDYRV